MSEKWCRVRRDQVYARNNHARNERGGKVGLLADALDVAHAKRNPARLHVAKLAAEIREAFPDLSKDPGTVQFRWLEMLADLDLILKPDDLVKHARAALDVLEA